MSKIIALSVVLLSTVFLGSSCRSLEPGEEDTLAETEQGLVLGSCSVTRGCINGTTPSVTCSSASGNCVLGSDYVQCDGITKQCIEQCTASLTCPNGSTVSCTGTECSTHPSSRSVICDGQGYICACTVSCSTNSQCDTYCGFPGNGYCTNDGCGAKKYCKCLF